jgi:DNA-binding winged helix-turn-helix (wHTH) protein
VVVADRIDLSSEHTFRVGSAIVDPIAHEGTYKGFTERLQPQNLKVLLALARKRETVVTREELIECCWDGRIVGDDVIHRAISTLRQFAARAGGFSIETVPRSGYRLTESKRRRHWPWIAGAAVLLLSIGGVLAMNKHGPVPTRAPTMLAQEQEALKTLSLDAVERLIRAGWDPNASMDHDGNRALHYLVGDCEWDHGHDHHQMVLIARTLLEAGARLDVRNVWGDTPYSIARARRYCGPDHPVTKMLRMYCAQGPKPLGDQCMAAYELQRGEHFTKG